MGLALLANLAARDFGYLTVGALIERTENAFATMNRLERHRGHFYNWYDTRTLRPLLPLYVSSVDSGNLAGHLLIYSAGLAELIDERIVTPQIFTGLRDTVEVLQRLAVKNSALARIDAELAKAPATLAEAADLLQRAADQAAAGRRPRPAWRVPWPRRRSGRAPEFFTASLCRTSTVSRRPVKICRRGGILSSINSAQPGAVR